jgi:hypothetical protein
VGVGVGLGPRAGLGIRVRIPIQVRKNPARNGYTGYDKKLVARPPPSEVHQEWVPLRPVARPGPLTAARLSSVLRGSPGMGATLVGRPARTLPTCRPSAEVHWEWVPLWSVDRPARTADRWPPVVHPPRFTGNGSPFGGFNHDNNKKTYVVHLIPF